MYIILSTYYCTYVSYTYFDLNMNNIFFLVGRENALCTPPGPGSVGFAPTNFYRYLFSLMGEERH